jgi:hypothetical protein
LIIDGHAHSCRIFYRTENIIRLLNELAVDKIPFYWINPNAPDMYQELKSKFSKWQVKGIKIHQPLISTKDIITSM